jgi:hypothetical protein
MQRVKHADGQYYVHGKIHWLIDKNDFFYPTDPPTTKYFARAFSLKSSGMLVCHDIVQFAGIRKEDRPDRVDPNLTPKICTIKFNLGSAITAASPFLPQEVKLQQRYLFGMRTFKYLEVKYNICVHPGPADLQFELWFAGKRYKCGEISVCWSNEGRIVLGAFHTSEQDSDCEWDSELRKCFLRC